MLSESLKQVHVKVKEVLRLYTSLQRKDEQEHENVVISSQIQVNNTSTSTALTEQHEQVKSLVEAISTVLEEHLHLGLTFQHVVIQVLKHLEKSTCPKSITWLLAHFEKRVKEFTSALQGSMNGLPLFSNTYELLCECLNKGCLADLVELVSISIASHVERFYVLERHPIFLGDEQVMMFKTLLQPLTTVTFQISQETKTEKKKKKKKVKKTIVSLGDSSATTENAAEEDEIAVPKKKKTASSKTKLTKKKSSKKLKAEEDEEEEQTESATPSTPLATTSSVGTPESTVSSTASNQDEWEQAVVSQNVVTKKSRRESFKKQEDHTITKQEVDYVDNLVNTDEDNVDTGSQQQATTPIPVVVSPSNSYSSSTLSPGTTPPKQAQNPSPSSAKPIAAAKSESNSASSSLSNSFANLLKYFKPQPLEEPKPVVAEEEKIEDILGEEDDDAEDIQLPPPKPIENTTPKVEETEENIESPEVNPNTVEEAEPTVEVTPEQQEVQPVEEQPVPEELKPQIEKVETPVQQVAEDDDDGLEQLDALAMDDLDEIVDEAEPEEDKSQSVVENVQEPISETPVQEASKQEPEQLDSEAKPSETDETPTAVQQETPTQTPVLEKETGVQPSQFSAKQETQEEQPAESLPQPASPAKKEVVEDIVPPKQQESISITYAKEPEISEEIEEIVIEDVLPESKSDDDQEVVIKQKKKPKAKPSAVARGILYSVKKTTFSKMVAHSAKTDTSTKLAVDGNLNDYDLVKGSLKNINHYFAAGDMNLVDLKAKSQRLENIAERKFFKQQKQHRSEELVLDNFSINYNEFEKEGKLLKLSVWLSQIETRERKLKNLEKNLLVQQEKLKYQQELLDKQQLQTQQLSKRLEEQQSRQNQLEEKLKTQIVEQEKAKLQIEQTLSRSRSSSTLAYNSSPSPISVQTTHLSNSLQTPSKMLQPATPEVALSPVQGTPNEIQMDGLVKKSLMKKATAAQVSPSSSLSFANSSKLSPMSEEDETKLSEADEEEAPQEIQIKKPAASSKETASYTDFSDDSKSESGLDSEHDSVIVRHEDASPAATSSSFGTSTTSNSNAKYSTSIPNYSDSTFELTRSGRHMKLIVEMPRNLDSQKVRNEIMAEQKNKCAQCDKLLSKDYGLFRKPRVCYYTGKIYCMDCHKNDSSIIPAMVMSEWDFKEYKVCVAARDYLQEIATHPVLCISAVRPQLFDKVANLKKARMIRKRLMLQWETVEHCSRKQGLIQKLNLHNNMHLVTDTEVYSLQNLVEMNCSAEVSPYLKQLAQLFHHLSQHITQACMYCKNKSKLTCEKCFNPEPIFLFNLTNVIQCPVCKKVYHKNCFKDEKGSKACPHCCS